MHYGVAVGADAALLADLDEGLRDRDPLLAFLALVLVLAFCASALALTFLGLAFAALVRVAVALPTERRRAGFSGVVSGAGAGIAADCLGLRPSPMLLASWDRRSE
jgi:hypothetical protein